MAGAQPKKQEAVAMEASYSKTVPYLRKLMNVLAAKAVSPDYFHVNSEGAAMEVCYWSAVEVEGAELQTNYKTFGEAFLEQKNLNVSKKESEDGNTFTHCHALM